MAIELPPLPYEHSALEPHISAETVEFHHGKHQRAYVDRLNALVAGTGFAEASLEEIVRKAQGEMFNNAAQAWNHAFYWQCLRPSAGGGGGTPSGALAEAIDKAFGGFDAFRQQFDALAMRTFGSGWVWLVRRTDGGLALATTANAATPLTGSDTPLLTCDVWEHAYYIDYRNARAKYLEAFWNVVNWDFVASNL
ncbi:superoxide dismutase [Luteimonas mephitis]|jgi:Fe-Mn family superoxide dismutase|uniref:superoxide dismutase n=1 Tax=Luteimonas mephitis TaxID=83615 RepID=UPI00042815DA|nr:Fe-Mn family superoxide dismutase [Luteimonas mephitis]